MRFLALLLVLVLQASVVWAKEGGTGSGPRYAKEGGAGTGPRLTKDGGSGSGGKGKFGSEGSHGLARLGGKTGGSHTTGKIGGEGVRG